MSYSYEIEIVEVLDIAFASQRQKYLLTFYTPKRLTVTVCMSVRQFTGFLQQYAASKEFGLYAYYQNDFFKGITLGAPIAGSDYRLVADWNHAQRSFDHKKPPELTVPEMVCVYEELKDS